MLESIQAPAARASIVWMVGSYHHLVPKIAPDALRELAKSFKAEEAQVKLCRCLPSPRRVLQLIVGGVCVCARR